MAIVNITSQAGLNGYAGRLSLFNFGTKISILLKLGSI